MRHLKAIVQKHSEAEVNFKGGNGFKTFFALFGAATATVLTGGALAPVLGGVAGWLGGKALNSCDSECDEQDYTGRGREY